MLQVAIVIGLPDIRRFTVREGGRYISPFTDFGFKKLFGTEMNKDILMDFLNELLKKDEAKIVDLTYLPKEQLGRAEWDWKAIFDIYCESKDGEKFIVELQKAKQNYFKDRSIYYSTFPIREQGEKGDWSFKLKAVYTIGILDFVFDEDKEDNDVFHHEVQLIDKSTQKVFYDKLTYIYLEMPKFNKTEEELETHFDKWMYIIRNLEFLSGRPGRIQERIFQKLFKQAEIANYSEEEYSDYSESLKVYRDLKNTIDTAFDDGEIQGMAQGVAKGLAKGLAKGRVEGKAEGRIKEKAEVVRIGRRSGISTEILSALTGLSKEEIKEIPSE
ncbi:MAG: Rpn family recombination-promoting nuclease/putative transposase [Candidatus Sabulitectum sp.]|nr:Rpn family recombination-promoting nuclease/putative transposase [Candidatus Sabulitectum sp.]